MTTFQDNAGSFATTQDQRVRELRRQASIDAVGFIVEGHPHIAADIMTETLEAQMRIAGIRPLEAVTS